MELHPWLQQKDFVKFNHKKDIHVTQYSPFGNKNELYSKEHGELVNDAELVKLVDIHDGTSNQIVLSESIISSTSRIILAFFFSLEYLSRALRYS